MGGFIRRSHIVPLVGLVAVFLPVLGSTASAVAANGLIAPRVGTQLAELNGSGIVADDGFGVSVAISGTTAVVGVPGFAKDAGRADIFTKTGELWTQAAQLKGSDTVSGDDFGYTVAIAGSNALVDAPGHGKDAGRAYVFAKTAAGWSQVAELKGSDTAAGSYFGYTSAMSGTTALVDAPGYAKEAGRAYVFTKTATGWEQAAELKGSDTRAGDTFGGSAAISGTTAIVDAPDHAKDAGRAYVFTETASRWKQVAELKGSDTGAKDGFGVSVAISGTTAIAGSPNHAKDAGRAYVFTKTATGWKQVAELKGSDTGANNGFGVSVSISGTTAIAGAPGYGKDAGRAYLFRDLVPGWRQTAELKGSDTVAGDYFGYSVQISGPTVITGADGHAKNAGRAYLFAA